MDVKSVTEGMEDEERGSEKRTPGEGMAAPIQVTAVRMGLVGKAALRAARRGERAKRVVSTSPL